ncbi:MAG: hypothetical protein L0Z50_30815, partial [Verrucomicrobiales bacterium]|nr:hypothetical protein [Verrucomicrobiales bacterium]
MGSQTGIPLSLHGAGHRLPIAIVLVSVVLLPGLLSAATGASSVVAAVRHMPEQPKSGEKVTIVVQAQAAVKDTTLVLQYQVVDPGKYIARADSAYAQQWTSVPLRPESTSGGSPAGTSLRAELPAELQKHRRLVRYRLASPQNNSVVAPASEDSEPNFAYFVYDGIPDWRGAINPKSNDPKLNKVVTFDTNVMASVQAYHLISKRTSIENVTWREPTEFMQPERHEYKYTGTLVAHGKVYDHVRFRARGGQWRHSMGKNMWKIDFNKGHGLAARDDFGRPYKTKWDKLNLGACIQQGSFGMRGEHGMFEA